MFRFFRRMIMVGTIAAALSVAVGAVAGPVANASPASATHVLGEAVAVAAQPDARFDLPCPPMWPMCVTFSRAETAHIADVPPAGVAGAIAGACSKLPPPGNGVCGILGGVYSVQAKMLANEARDSGRCLAISMFAGKPDLNIFPCKE
jgi:hypothetical protein